MNKILLASLLIFASCSTIQEKQEPRRLPCQDVEITIDIREEDFTDENGFFDRYSYWYTKHRATNIVRYRMRKEDPNRTKPLTVVIRPIEELQ